MMMMIAMARGLVFREGFGVGRTGFQKTLVSSFNFQFSKVESRFSVTGNQLSVERMPGNCWTVRGRAATTRVSRVTCDSSHPYILKNPEFPIWTGNPGIKAFFKFFLSFKKPFFFWKIYFFPLHQLPTPTVGSATPARGAFDSGQ